MLSPMVTAFFENVVQTLECHFWGELMKLLSKGELRNSQKGQNFVSIKYENGDDNVKLALFFVGFWYK